MVCLLKLRNQQWYSTVDYALHFWGHHQFSTNVLSRLQDPVQVTTLHLVVMAPQSSLVYDSFSVFTCFYDLDISGILVRYLWSVPWSGFV